MAIGSEAPAPTDVLVAEAIELMRGARVAVLTGAGVSTDSGIPDYRGEVLPESVMARVSVEKASTLGWARYVGAGGCSIGMDTFGASAPLQELKKKFGFTVDHVVAAARQQIGGTR